MPRISYKQVFLNHLMVFLVFLFYSQPMIMHKKNLLIIFHILSINNKEESIYMISYSNHYFLCFLKNILQNDNLIHLSLLKHKNWKYSLYNKCIYDLRIVWQDKLNFQHKPNFSYHQLQRLLLKGYYLHIFNYLVDGIMYRFWNVFLVLALLYKMINKNHKYIEYYMYGILQDMEKNTKLKLNVFLFVFLILFLLLCVFHVFLILYVLSLHLLIIRLS